VKSRKIIVAVAPTGGSVMKDDTPHVPTQPDEIAKNVAECYKLGASLAYLHVRTKTDDPCCDPDIYRTLNKLIRESCPGVVINNSTGGGLAGDMVREYAPGKFEVRFEERLRGLRGNPDVITVDTSTVVVVRKGKEVVFNTTPSECDALIKGAHDLGIKPELMGFSAANVTQDINRLIHQGYDNPPYMVNLTVGFPSTTSLPYTPPILDFMVGLLNRDNVVLTVTGMGDDAFLATTHAILLGANGVRVGIEDTVEYSPGKLATNQDLVKRAVRMIRELGCEPASAGEARQMLGLPMKN
jgi:uncharacterized protein (DUF849 family)